MPPKTLKTADQVRAEAEKRREESDRRYELPRQKGTLAIGDRPNRDLSPFPRDKPKDRK
jgi:hypothetical protein